MKPTQKKNTPQSEGKTLDELLVKEK